MDDAEHAQHCAHTRVAIKALRNFRGRFGGAFCSGCDFFAEEGFRSKTLTCVKNNKGIDVLEFARKLREKHHLVIDPGYGKIRGKTFRLSNMGDETEETVSHLLTCLDDVL